MLFLKLFIEKSWGVNRFLWYLYLYRIKFNTMVQNIYFRLRFGVVNSKKYILAEGGNFLAYMRFDWIWQTRVLFVLNIRNLWNQHLKQRRAQPWGIVCICPPCFKTGGAYAPPESMPPLKFEIVCFCPCWKKLSGGADGADSKTPPVTSLL